MREENQKEDELKSVASAELYLTCGDLKSHRRKIIQQRSGGSHTKSPFQSTNWRTMPPWQALKMILYNRSCAHFESVVLVIAFLLKEAFSKALPENWNDCAYLKYVGWHLLTIFWQQSSVLACYFLIFPMNSKIKKRERAHIKMEIQKGQWCSVVLLQRLKASAELCRYKTHSLGTH